MDRSRRTAAAFDVSGIDAAGCVPMTRAGGSGSWDRRAVAATSGEQTRWLSRTIETEIIPRLMLVHGGRRPGELAEADGSAELPDAAQVERFATLTLGGELEPLLDEVRRLRAGGLGLEAVYLHLLAPSARRLGTLWESDELGFAEVTLGLWRLQQVMHELGAAFQHAGGCNADGRRALLAPVPGSQHTLGLFMVAEFFRRAGWDVWGDATVSAAQIVRAVRDGWFDVVGLSIGSEVHVHALASVILDMRKASRNPSMLVLIGGPIVASSPGLVASVGADAWAEDAEQAVAHAERMLVRRAAAS